MLHWSQLKGFSPAKDGGENFRVCATAKKLLKLIEDKLRHAFLCIKIDLNSAKALIEADLVFSPPCHVCRNILNTFTYHCESSHAAAGGTSE